MLVTHVPKEMLPHVCNMTRCDRKVRGKRTGTRAAEHRVCAGSLALEARVAVKSAHLHLHNGGKLGQTAAVRTQVIHRLDLVQKEEVQLQRGFHSPILRAMKFR